MPQFYLVLLREKNNEFYPNSSWLQDTMTESSLHGKNYT